MASYANNVAHQKLWATSITVTQGTRARVLVDHSPGGLRLPDSALIETPGGTAPPGAPMVTRGGQRIIGGTITSTDASAKDILIYRGTTLTSQATAITGVLQAATQSTIGRAAGSFILDGWRIGETVMPFGPGPVGLADHGNSDYTSVPALLANAGVLAIVTGVTSTTLTVNGTPLTVETMAGCRLVRVSQVARITIAANSGNAAATPSVALVGNANEADINGLSAADRGLSLGPSDVVAVAAQAPLSGLPAYITFNASSLLY